MSARARTHTHPPTHTHQQNCTSESINLKYVKVDATSVKWGVNYVKRGSTAVEMHYYVKSGSTVALLVIPEEYAMVIVA